MWCTITIDLFKGLNKIVPIGILVDSPTRWVGESFFDYEYLREYEAQIGTGRNVVKGTYAEPISAKTPENPPRCHVPLTYGILILWKGFFMLPHLLGRYGEKGEG
jgi:hypothetical protein